MEEQNEDRTLIRASSRLRRLESERDDIAEMLATIREDIRDLRTRIRQGEVSRSAEDAKLMADIRYWLRASRETEAEIEDIRRKEEGIVGEYGLDLEQACVAVRCQLDSLRACCGAGEVS
ncbi:hypothetical protein [Thetidibacter halocola]|uniref:Uncharacterized protein n=1 Tax=Thetidibacter halocola TaxID=2827239 RepID=A0A8J7WEH7_9RHOB|nr:hypothetical protein [Thetidibacter halocola]MBS0124236.1 hypothetical protein [Thetidibacter halocola]